MKKPFLIVVIFVMLAFFAYQKWFKVPFYHAQSYVFGTLVDISIVGEKQDRASKLANHIFQDFQSLHERLHAWKLMADNTPSELQVINQAFAQAKSITVSTDVAQMLQTIQSLSTQSQGLFNPAIGHLIHAWGFQRDEFSEIQISTETIKALVEQHPHMDDIQINNLVLSSDNTAVNLDLGGYAKGYALDIAVNYLKAQQVKNALINIGGNIIAIGENQGKPWRVGIQHPRKPEAIATIDLLDGWAIGTSGDYQRYFTQAGKRYCHLIDPSTGYPIQHTQAVTVLVPPNINNTIGTGVLSDVASKPIFIAAFAKKAAMAKRLGIHNYLVIDQHGKVFVSADMQKKLHWIDRDAKVSILQ
jgi:thiamine biosynthesis lipoprotein